jgi:ABC-2 type transport system permease protein
MIPTIASHEARLLTRSGAVVSLLAAFSLVTAAAVVLGSARLRATQRDAALLHAEAARSRVAVRSAESRANEQGAFAVLPAAPLLGLSAGQSDVFPDHYRVTARLRDAQLASNRATHPLALMTGQLDLTFVMLYLYPLLILGISYDLTATERFTGTLRMLLAQGIRLHELIAGKVLARLAVVVIPPIASTVVAMTTLGVESLPRLAVWTTFVLGYGLFWLALAVLVNARGKAASANALTLAGAWLALVVLVPAIVNVVARMVYPPPSRVELAITSRVATRAAVVEGSRLLGRFLEDHPSSGIGQQGMQQYYLLQDAREAEVARRLQPVLDVYEQQHSRQRQFVSRAQYLSPTILTQLALTDAAGTSGHRHRRFNGQVLDFQRLWKAHFPADVLAAAVVTPALLSAEPVFGYREEPLAMVVRRITPPMLWLWLLAGGLLWAAMRTYTREDYVGA